MIASQDKFNLGENANISQKIVVKSSNIETIVSDMLKILGAKQKLVLSSRFGISGSEPQTLEAIGKSLNITRERVRQIEADALNLLKKGEQSLASKELFSIIEEIVKEKGEIVKEDTLVNGVFEKYFGAAKQAPGEKNFAEVVFSVIGLKKIKGSKEMNDSWASRDFDIKKFRGIVSQIEKIFDESKKLLQEEDLLKKIEYTDIAKNFPGIASEQILNYIEISKKFGKNIFGSWGKAKWPLVNPRGVREKATLVLLGRKKPLHFREISQQIEKMGLSDKKVHPQTVHNELIRDKRFVLVGRGTYALREWGYEEGTVKDIIISLIKSAGGALSRENIVNSVLKKRKVKEATIAVNLSDKKVFEKSKGGYILK